MSHKSIQLAAAIANRRAGNKAAFILHTYNYEILLVVGGHGTVSPAVMDCLGLDEPERDLVLGFSNKSGADRPFHALGWEMEFYKPERDIAFTLPLSGISLAATDILSRHKDQATPNGRTVGHEEDISMTNSHSYELIASVIHTNLSTPVMGTVRKAGYQGGTLIKAREIGIGAGKKLFSTALSQEKTILLILTPVNLRFPMLKVIYEAIVKETGEHAMAISLPADAVGGLAG